MGTSAKKIKGKDKRKNSSNRAKNLKRIQKNTEIINKLKTE